MTVHSSRLLSRLLAASALFAALAGCGAGGGEKTAAVLAPPAGAEKPVYAMVAENRFKDTVLRFGTNAIAGSSGMQNRRGALSQYIRNAVGVKEVVVVTARSYAGALDQLLAGEADISWLGGYDYVCGSKVKKLIPLVKPIVNGSTTYTSTIVAREESGIRTMADLRGKRFAWVDPNSTSGYIMPLAAMRAAGFVPERDLVEQEFLETHAAVVINVVLGEFDAGACYYGAQNILGDPAKAAKLRIIATTREISTEPIVCTEKLDPELRNAVTEALLKLTENGVKRFAGAADSDYDSIREEVGRLTSIK